MSQDDPVHGEKQDTDNLVSFQIGGDDILYKETDVVTATAATTTTTTTSNNNNNTFNGDDVVPMNSQYATVDSVDSVRFAKHATVFTVPRHKHSIKKKVSRIFASF